MEGVGDEGMDATEGGRGDGGGAGGEVVGREEPGVSEETLSPFLYKIFL